MAVIKISTGENKAIELPKLQQSPRDSKMMVEVENIDEAIVNYRLAQISVHERASENKRRSLATANCCDVLPLLFSFSFCINLDAI
ncbi:jg17783 [Pararge aegeria aegeria]|uniref:Jg17783 protein n=1 Tax=Pararge aegeria aegeria TaxID=348720 RepID=A0A8S4R908_9NEOP|nr:jg17783 [Pararge aegeria aegeria]